MLDELADAMRRHVDVDYPRLGADRRCQHATATEPCAGPAERPTCVPRARAGGRAGLLLWGDGKGEVCGGTWTEWCPWGRIVWGVDARSVSSVTATPRARRESPHFRLTVPPREARASPRNATLACFVASTARPAGWGIEAISLGTGRLRRIGLSDGKCAHQRRPDRLPR